MEFGTREYWPDGTNVEKPNNTASDRSFLRDLSPGTTNKLLVGVVISKLSVHSFPDKRNPGCNRYSLGFTLRDSPTDFVNVTCWGNDTFINDIAKSFKINDVVEIRNPQVSPKQGSDYEQQWKPWTPSNIQLNVSEAHSTVSLYSGWDLSDMNVLIHTPVKEHGDYCVIDDILSSGQNIHGDHMNVLVAVKNVAQPRDLMTKRGKQIQKCDVQVFDETCNSFLMTIWDENTIEMTMSWSPGETVLFIADLKIVYDDYKKTMASVCGNRTIITVNPDIRQAHQLYSYAQSPEILNGLISENSGGDNGAGFNLEGITEVYSIEKIKQTITKAAGDTSSDNINGIVFAYLTKFNIDDNIDNILAMRCNKCKRRVNSLTGQCDNPTCSDENHSESQLTYNLLVDISDQSGTIINCRMMSSALETVLGYPPDQFQQLPASAIAEFKTKYLLEKCKIYFRISKNTRSNSVLVLSCALADPEEIAENTKL